MSVYLRLDGRGRECPECGSTNSPTRMTCEVCHGRMWSTRKETSMDELARELYTMNKKLRQAMTAGDEKMIKKVRKQIEVAVKKSGGRFKVGEHGLATQASTEAVATKKSPVEKKTTVMHKCPCCGEEVKGYFKMGHDGRVHGILIKLDLGKIKPEETTKEVNRMYEIWKKNKDLTMKQLAMKIQ